MIRVTLIALLILSGCVGTPSYKDNSNNKPLPEFLTEAEETLFGDPVKVIPVERLFLLSEAQKKDFLKAFNSRELSHLTLNHRVYSYLRTRLKEFSFYLDTLTASESLSLKRGNCLSLAILTKALADTVNVDIGFQLIESVPVFQKEGDLLLSSLHIRSILYDPTPRSIARGRVIVDYFPEDGSHVLRAVGRAEFYSMYYRNKAAELLIENNVNRAYWYLMKSLEIDSNDHHAINMLGLLYRKKGRADLTETLYLFGLSITEEKLDLLTNYHSLLKSQHRDDEAQKIADELDKERDLNPFKWVRLGNEAFNNENYAAAITYFRRALSMAPYLHEPLAGIARSQYQLGYYQSAKKALEEAIDKAQQNLGDDDALALYQAKYDLLTQLLEKKN